MKNAIRVTIRVMALFILAVGAGIALKIMQKSYATELPLMYVFAGTAMLSVCVCGLLILVVSVMSNHQK